jgi:hypothetical protein
MKEIVIPILLLLSVAIGTMRDGRKAWSTVWPIMVVSFIAGQYASWPPTWKLNDWWMIGGYALGILVAVGVIYAGKWRRR